MPDDQLADELIKRLNGLLTDPEWGERFGVALAALNQNRVSVSEEFAEGHPTAQCSSAPATFGIVGLLNAIVGLRTDGSGYGYVAAEVCCCEEHVIKQFVRSDSGAEA